MSVTTPRTIKYAKSLRNLLLALAVASLTSQMALSENQTTPGDARQVKESAKLRPVRPPHIPPPPEPRGNSVSKTRIDLGRRLFFDIRLSGPGYMSCATCHRPERAFTDGRPVAMGITGEKHTRNTPTLTNVAYLSRLGWAQPKQEHLEQQLLRPLFSEHPIEMGTLGHELHVLGHIRGNSIYRSLFLKAFPENDGDVSFDTIAMAIAAFQRTLVSATSPYDRFKQGDQSALSPSANRGLALFKSDRLNCSACHKPPFFTDATTANPKAQPFHNTSLYNDDGHGRLPGSDQGLANETGKATDIGKFRTPTLRNVAVTGPYMHDGSITTLEAVIAHYAAGGRAARFGTPSPLRSAHIKSFTITQTEKADLVAFLKSLTDELFLQDERFHTPFR